MDGSLSLNANDMVGNKSFETNTDDHRQTFPQAEELYSDEDENFTVDRREDVKSLLNFVNLAGDNIKASLDRSASCKRAVDHKKYLQKQLQHFSNSSQPLRSFGGPTYPPPGTASVRQQSYVKNKPDQYHCLNTRAIQAVNKCTSPLKHLHPDEQSDNSNKLNEHDKKRTCVKTVETETDYSVPTFDSCLSSSVTLSMAAESDSKVSDVKTNTENDEETRGEEQDKAADVDVKVTADLVLMDSLFKQSDIESGEKSSKSSSGDKKTVPLRQRSLPASFWKEPNNPQSTGCQNGRNGYSFMHCQPQFPAHTVEYNNSNFETLYRLPHGITNIPYHAPPSVHPSLTQLSSLKNTLATMEYPKYPLTIPYDEKNTANLGLSTGRNYPYVLPNSSRILSARDYVTGSASLPQFHMHSVPVQSGLGHSLHPGRLHVQTCLDCCTPRHHHSLSVPPGIVQPTTYCRIPTVNSILTHRPSLWKPIPTKSMSSFPSRYHPFAGVQ